MKMKVSMKKILLVSALLVFTVAATGCSVPTDETGAIKLIQTTTTFGETMSSENWFNAILVWPLAQMLNALAPKVGVAGAIAAVTALVNALLMLATLKSTIASQQMQLLQPEMDRIQKKYEGKTDDASRMKQAQEMNALYQKYDVNPFSMILITFLQFPVIIAIYQSVQRSAAIKTGTFMGLSLETTVLNGIRSGKFGYIGIFVVMGICQAISMYLPMYISKKKAKAEAEKHHRKPADTSMNGTNKMMQIYMLGMILVFGLMWPAAMSIYWAIYSIVNIIKTLAIQVIINNRTPKAGMR